jgi:hypothetical protein
VRRAPFVMMSVMSADNYSRFIKVSSIRFDDKKAGFERRNE